MNRLNQSRRQTFGYVYPNMVQNNVTKPVKFRNNYDVMEYPFDQSSQSINDMSGEGIMDIARGIYNKGKQAASYLYEKRGAIKDMGEKAADFYGSDFGKSLQNILPSSDETARDGFPGERHAILQLPNGKYGVANYMGPGTQVIKRLKRGDPPRTLSDKTAMRHDIDYAIAAGLKNKEAQNKAIREADQRMVRNLDRIAKMNGDAKKNIFQGRRLIQGKMAAEDVGLMAKGSFGGDLAPISDEDKIILMSNRARLGQEGYGNLPAQQLKMKLLKAHSRKQKGKGLHPGGGGLSLAGGGLRLAGGGLRLAGGMCISAPQMKKVHKCVKCQLMKGNGMVDMIKSVAKVLGPVAKEIGKKALKEVVIPYAIDKIKKKMGFGEDKEGDGLRLAGQKGRGVINKWVRNTNRPWSVPNNLRYPMKKGRGLKLSGGRVSMGKPYGTSKGYPMKGGFFWFLPAAIAGIAEAVAATAATGLATGAASALGSHITKKIIGDGMMKGRGVGDVAKKVAQVIGKKKDTIIKVAKATKVLPAELPKQVLEKADTALRAIQEVSGNKPPKEKIMGVVKMLIPHVRKVFDEKLKSKIGVAGSGLSIAGGSNDKILSIVKKKLF